jgi:hypothetical protein
MCNVHATRYPEMVLHRTYHFAVAGVPGKTSRYWYLKNRLILLRGFTVPTQSLFIFNKVMVCPCIIYQGSGHFFNVGCWGSAS